MHLVIWFVLETDGKDKTRIQWGKEKALLSWDIAWHAAIGMQWYAPDNQGNMTTMSFDQDRNHSTVEFHHMQPHLLLYWGEWRDLLLEGSPKLDIICPLFEMLGEVREKTHAIRHKLIPWNRGDVDSTRLHIKWSCQTWIIELIITII